LKTQRSKFEAHGVPQSCKLSGAREFFRRVKNPAEHRVCNFRLRRVCNPAPRPKPYKSFFNRKNLWLRRVCNPAIKTLANLSYGR